MATFTVKVTIAGSVQGRPINFEHTATVTGIEDIGQDNDIADNVGNRIFMQGGGSYHRGQSNFSACDFVIVNNTTSNAVGYVSDIAEGVQMLLRTGLPILYWQSHDYDAAIGYDAGTPASPNSDVTGVNIICTAGHLAYNALAFFRALT